MSERESSAAAGSIAPSLQLPSAEACVHDADDYFGRGLFHDPDISVPTTPSPFDNEQLEADDDDDDGQPSTKKQKVEDPPLVKVQDFMKTILRRMKDAGVKVSKIEALQLFTVVTGKWSGAGTMGIAFQYFREAVQEVFPEFEIYSQLFSETDWDEHAQSLLSCLDPLHLHSNLLSQFSEEAIETVTRYQGKLRYCLESVKSNPNVLLQHKAAQKEDNIRLFVLQVRQAMLKLGKTAFKTEDECLIHDGKCFLTPDKQGWLWLELISPTCTAWSARGKGLGWADSANLPLILHCCRWAHSEFRPHLTIVECTPRLDLRTMEEFSESNVMFSSICTSPDKFDMPTSGERLWATAASEPFHFKVSPFISPRVEQFTHTDLTHMPDPHMFCSAPLSDIKGHYQYINKRSHSSLPQHPAGKAYMCRHILAVGYKDRLREHEENLFHLRARARRNGTQDETPELFQAQFFDIAQSPNFHKGPDGRIPRPLLNSNIWSEKFQRLMTPLEIWSSQGGDGPTVCLCMSMMYIHTRTYNAYIHNICVCAYSYQPPLEMFCTLTCKRNQCISAHESRRASVLRGSVC